MTPTRSIRRTRWRRRPRRRLPAAAPTLLWLVAGLPLLAPPGATAQDDEPPFDLSISTETGALQLQVGNLFDQELVQALHSGLPIRIQFVAELWKDGFFDSQRGRADWRASVLFDPLSRRYRVATGTEGVAEATVDSLRSVRRALEDLFELPLSPADRGRFYYLGQLAIETLSLSDLDELERWLRGDLNPTPADERERERQTAIGRGLRRLFVSVLGLPARRLRWRSPTFDFAPSVPR